MKILFIGDVVGEPGCEFVRKKLGGIKKNFGIDFCIVNAENSAKGNGVTPFSADFLLDSGADLLTLGNHALRRQEIYEYLDEERHPVIRPANMHRSVPGRGCAVLTRGALKLGVFNLLGTMHMDAADNPYDAADEALKYFEKENVNTVFLDFHAEATSEKKCMGYYLDGKVSVVAGTHTHVQTADERILPGGTAYITDTGMTGPVDSVLGVKTENVLSKMRTGMPARFDTAAGVCEMDCIIAETDDKTGRAISIERLIIS